MLIQYKGSFIYIHEGCKTTVIQISSIHRLTIKKRQHTILLESGSKELEYKLDSYSHMERFLQILQQAMGIDLSCLNGQIEEEDIPRNQDSFD